MTKDISMKKLHKWADEWAGVKDNNSDVQIGTREEDRRILSDFLHYVWEHRND